MTDDNSKDFVSYKFYKSYRFLIMKLWFLIEKVDEPSCVSGVAKDNRFSKVKLWEPNDQFSHLLHVLFGKLVF